MSSIKKIKLRNRKDMKYIKDLKIKYETDVLIAGGGPAGISAAYTAAKLGKKTMLLEDSGVLGGMGTKGLVPEFMCFDDGINLLSGGVGKIVKEKFYGTEREFKVYNIKVEELKRLYDEIITESGVKLLLFSSVIDVVRENNIIKYAIVSSKSGIYAVSAKEFIDCTGDGNLSVMAGAEYEFGDDEGVTMPATLCSFWSGIDFEKKVKPDGCKVGDAYLDGVLSQLDLLLPGIKEVDRNSGVGGGNVGHAYAVDVRDEEKLTDAMISSRKTVAEYEEYYRKYVSGCEKAFLCATSTVLGVRESRRIVCDYMMDVQDYLNRRVFGDEIGRYNYPIDIHPKKADRESVEQFKKDTSVQYGKGESYGISMRCLLVKGFENLLIAGKCVGAKREMQASMRVMPCCFITGQGAAAVACVAIDEEVSSHKVEYVKVKEILKKLNAYL